jgi:hypothetical protein
MSTGSFEGDRAAATRAAHREPVGENAEEFAADTGSAPDTDRAHGLHVDQGADDRVDYRDAGDRDLGDPDDDGPDDDDPDDDGPDDDGPDDDGPDDDLGADLSPQLYEPVPASYAVTAQPTLREGVLEREKAQFGGVKVGSALFGWLAANGTAVLLTAIVAATGAAIGLGSGPVEEFEATATPNAGTVGVVGAIALVVILFVSYFCGGYVAGRMARFNGARQGVAVWLWAITIAIVAAVVAAIAGSRYNILATLNSFPRIPIAEGTLTAGSVITLIVVIIVSLAGAILGGVAGMRYHRKVDRIGLGR